MSIARFKGTVYPDKSFSLGIVPSPKKSAQDRQYDRDIRQQEETDYGNVADWLVGTLDIGGKFVSTSESPLFIESPKSSQKRRGSYGKHGITPYGKKFVRNACILLEQRYTKKRLGFCTCTLPALPPEVQRVINGHWGEVTRRFYQKLRRIAAKRNRAFIHVGVTEIQEKRFRKYGVPVPHLHFVYVCSDTPGGQYLMSIKDMWQAWNSSIRQVCKLFVPDLCMDAIDRTGSVHGQRIQKSAAGYLGKYLTKGGAVLEAMQKNGWLEFPRQWWTACMQCKKMFKESLIHLDSKECEAFFYNHNAYMQRGELTYVHLIYITLNERDVCIGLYGCMSDAVYAMFKRYSGCRNVA